MHRSHEQVRDGAGRKEEEAGATFNDVADTGEANGSGQQRRARHHPQRDTKPQQGEEESSDGEQGRQACGEEASTSSTSWR